MSRRSLTFLFLHMVLLSESLNPVECACASVHVCAHGAAAGQDGLAPLRCDNMFALVLGCQPGFCNFSFKSEGVFVYFCLKLDEV